MCEAKIIKFEDGAVFLAATEVTDQIVNRIHTAARFVTGNDRLPDPADSAIFQQVTDSVSWNLFADYAGLQLDMPVEMTPEELVSQGFSEKAIINGLRAARPLSHC